MVCEQQVLGFFRREFCGAIIEQMLETDPSYCADGGERENFQQDRKAALLGHSPMGAGGGALIKEEEMVLSRFRSFHLYHASQI